MQQEPDEFIGPGLTPSSRRHQAGLSRGDESIDVVSDEVRTERDHQLPHFDALDQKAGIVLGFAGALVALAPARGDIILLLGRAAAVVSGFFSLSTFWPRRYWTTDLRSLRDKYLAAEPSFMRLRLLDTQIDMIERRGRSFVTRRSG